MNYIHNNMNISYILSYTTPRNILQNQRSNIWKKIILKQFKKGEMFEFEVFRIVIKSYNPKTII